MKAGDSIACPACGTRLRDTRTHCLRCGASLTTAAPARWRPRLALAVIGTVAGIGLVGAVAALAVRPSATGSASVSTLSAAEAGTVRPAGAPDISTPSAVPLAPEPGIAAIDASRVALAAYNGGDVAASIEAFTRAVEANPVDAVALNNLGQVLVRAGRAREALPYFSRAIEVSPATWAYHFNRARAYAEVEQWADASRGYREAARLFPDDYATQYNLAKALHAEGDLPAAIEAFERAIVLAPGQADFHLSHGLALEAAQRPKLAVQAYRKFLELEPDAADADRIKARISELEGL